MDLWDMVRLAKNPWCSKTRMKTLKDVEENNTKEGEKARVFEKAHFLLDKCKEREEKEEEEEEERGAGLETGEEEIEDKVLDTLSRTSNTFAPEPIGINYQILKWVNKIVLAEYLISEVVDNLLQG